MSGYCDETYAVYNERLTKARKVHRCGACHEPIEPGHYYYRIRGVHSDGVDGYKRCLRCQALHVHLRGLGEHDEWPDERLDCGLDYEDHWNTPPPPHVAALAFASPDEMQAELTARRKSGYRWICIGCLPRRTVIEESLIGGVFVGPCAVCGATGERDQMRYVLPRNLPPHLQARLL